MPATVGILNGTDLCLYNGSTKIAYSQSCKVTAQLDMRDTTNKDTSGWKTVLPGLRSFTMETSGLMALDNSYNAVYLLNLLLNKTALTVKLKTANVNDSYITGVVYITSVSIDSPSEANVTYSVSFVGTSTLAVVAGE